MTTEQENLWTTVGTSPDFVAQSDIDHVLAFNKAYPGDVSLDLSMPPDPWLGCWDAPVVMLQMNPSVGAGDIEAYARADVRALNRRNLIDEAGRLPHYWLDPQVSDTYAGRWWSSRLRPLTAELGVATVARRLLVLEFHGYHAPRHQPLPVTLPTQRLAFDLLAGAIQRDAIIVMNRALKAWQVAVPALGSHKRVVIGKNPRTSHLSPACLGQSGFDLVRSALASSTAESG